MFCKYTENLLAAVLFAMVEVVRLKFQWNCATQRRFSWKVSRKQSCKSQFFKFNNNGKLPQIFSLAYNLSKKTSNLCQLKFRRKSMQKQSGFFDHWNHTKNSTWKQRGFFDTRNYIKKKYVETTWIFRLAKLHQKSTWKCRRNSSRFGLWRVDIILTSNRYRFDVVCPLGYIGCDNNCDALAKLTNLR